MEADKAGAVHDHASRFSTRDPPADASDRVAKFWKKYSREADDYDKDFLLKNGNNIEGVLIFAGLFSAVSASFLVSMQADLKPDPTETTNALLMMLVHSANNTAFANQNIQVPVWNGPSSAVVCSQVLGYAALSSSLLAALGAVLGKQWLSNFTRLRNGPLQERGRRRQQKLDGLKAWRFEVFMGVLPALIQLALLLFSIALSINMWELNHGVGWMVIVTTAIGVLFYIFITLASLLSPTCPFHTPVSSTIHAAIRIAMKSIEEVAEYWAWRTDNHDQKQPLVGRGNKLLAYMTAFLLLPLLAVATIIFMTALVIFGPFVLLVAWVRGRGDLFRTKMKSYRSALQFQSLRTGLHDSVCWVRDTARHTRDFMRRVYLDPEPDSQDSDPRSIAWLLETSTDSDNLMAAAELVPDVKWPEDLDISLSTEHLYSIFIRSIPEKGPSNDRALRLGKAFIIMLCQMSKEVSPHVWRSALQRVADESSKPDVDSDLLFILTIVTKLLAHKLGSEDCGVEFPSSRDVSQPLLAWLLQPLETLLRLEHPRQSRFLPEAYRAFLKLKWPEESKLERMQEMQYCRTFEIYFNSVVGANDEKTYEAVEQSPQDPSKVQVDRLKRVLEKLKQVNLSRLPDVHQHLIVPFTVLSRLASISYLKQAFKEVGINYWMLAAFKGSISQADECGESVWLFTSCLVKLATVVDAFSPVEGPIENPQRSSDSRGQTPVAPLRMESKSLLTYLLNKDTPASSEQVVYAMNIMLANVDDLPGLASDPEFINYMLYTTGQGQVYSVRDIGLKVLVTACQFLLGTYDAQRLMTLASNCDLVRFVRRAILSQDPPAMLKDLLCKEDEDFNENLLRILAPILGDPFNALLTKLRDEPNKIPEGDLRDLEIALVLSGDDGRKKLLHDHLDGCIALMPLRDYKYTMALPLAVVVGWLLRRDGPLSASERVWKSFLRPGFEELLFPAWADPDTLEDNPQMLRLLVDCTASWLSTCVSTTNGSGTRSSSSSTSSPSPSSSRFAPSSVTLARLDYALDQLRSGSRALSSDIKRALHKLEREIKQLRLE